jgi:transposase
MSRRRRPTQGADSNDKARPGRRDEPDDHGIGRSRGGLSTKAHLLVDGSGRPLVIVVSPGQAGDAPALLPMLAQLRVARRGPGRPRTRPLLLRADKAYSARRHRQHLRRRGIKTVIPEPADQAAHRRRRGSAGGRPVSYDPAEYAAATSSNAAST